MRVKYGVTSEATYNNFVVSRDHLLVPRAGLAENSVPGEGISDLWAGLAVYPLHPPPMRSARAAVSASRGPDGSESADLKARASAYQTGPVAGPPRPGLVLLFVVRSAHTTIPCQNITHALRDAHRGSPGSDRLLPLVQKHRCGIIKLLTMCQLCENVVKPVKRHTPTKARH